MRPDERNKLLRQTFARLGPNPRSRAAAHYDRENFQVFLLLAVKANNLAETSIAHIRRVRACFDALRLSALELK
jgi:hypothetical protein